jgi:uncharacterized protein YdcH (DUF465 family)
MFEHEKETVQELLSDNDEFRRLFEKHQDLHKQVHQAEIGAAPMDDLSLVRLKKEKLLAKDRMARIMSTYQAERA